MVLVGGAALVVAVHPDPFGGWGLLALGPLLFLPAYALVFRTPPRGRRVAAASVAALAYALVYGVVAGLGDESLREVRRAVYVGLPALGLVVMLVCLAAGEHEAATTALNETRALLEPLNARPALARAAAIASSESRRNSGSPERCRQTHERDTLARSAAMV